MKHWLIENIYTFFSELIFKKNLLFLFIYLIPLLFFLLDYTGN